MISKKQLANDPRFYIDSYNLDRITKGIYIFRYKITDIAVGKVLRLKKHPGGDKIISLHDTSVYKYLNGSLESRNDYLNYCNNGNAVFRSEESYKKLIGLIREDGYNIKRGGYLLISLISSTKANIGAVFCCISTARSIR